MKHGFGEFVWSTGSRYKGNYVKDIKEGYGEMFWNDGSVYKGFWKNGVQDGLGIMIFNDGVRKAGFFANNIFEKPITSKEDLKQFKTKKGNVPQLFEQEVSQYV